MMRRSIIRGTCVLLLALCITAWVGSYWRALGFAHQGNKMYSLNIDCGRVLVGSWNLDASPPVWNASFYPPKGWTEWDATMGNRFLGFTFNGPTATYDTRFSVTIPLWFITAFSILLLRFIWRKTRPLYSGKAFPVEPATKSEESLPR